MNLDDLTVAQKSAIAIAFQCGGGKLVKVGGGNWYAPEWRGVRVANPTIIALLKMGWLQVEKRIDSIPVKVILSAQANEQAKRL